jgi:hypothetical protein
MLSRCIQWWSVSLRVNVRGNGGEKVVVAAGSRIEKGVSLTDIRILPGYMDQVLHQLGI